MGPSVDEGIKNSFGIGGGDTSVAQDRRTGSRRVEISKGRSVGNETGKGSFAAIRWAMLVEIDNQRRFDRRGETEGCNGRQEAVSFGFDAEDRHTTPSLAGNVWGRPHVDNPLSWANGCGMNGGLGVIRCDQVADRGRRIDP